MGRAPKVGDGDIFDKKWDAPSAEDALSAEERAAAEKLLYTKETWEDPTTRDIAVSNVVGVDGTPTEVHVPAGAVDFKMSFSTGGDLGVQFEIFPLCGDWMRHLHTEILEKGADDKLTPLASPRVSLPTGVSLTGKSAVSLTSEDFARDSIEALEKESWGGRPGSGPFWAGARAAIEPAVDFPKSGWEFCSGPGPHTDENGEPITNPYGVFLEAGCNRFPYLWNGEEFRGDGTIPGTEWTPTICLESDNVHGTITLPGATSRGFGIKMHTLAMTMPHDHRRRTDDADGHKHNSECKKIAEEECMADAECKWEAGECVTALSDTDHLDFHATYKYVVEEGGMCAATYAAAVASHSVAFPPREPYMQPRTPPALTTGFEAMRMTVDTMVLPWLPDARSGLEDLTAYLRALLPSRIDDVFDLNVLTYNVINGLVTPYGFVSVTPYGFVTPPLTFPKSIPGADGLESVYRSLGVAPVDIDALLDPAACPDPTECAPAKLSAKYVSDFIAAMFADIQKGAVGQCDCETACAPLTSFQPDSFKTYYDEAVPPQWIWEPGLALQPGALPCRAIPVEGNTNDGYTILGAEDVEVYLMAGTPIPVVYQCPADGGYFPIMTASLEKPHTLMKDHLQWYKFSKATSEFEPVNQAPEEFGQCVAACEASKTGYGSFETAFVSRCAEQAMQKLFVVERTRQQRLSDAGN
jgi:hypothetical protein